MEPLWVSGKKKVKIKDMTNTHILNAISKLQGHQEPKFKGLNKNYTLNSLIEELEIRKFREKRQRLKYLSAMSFATKVMWSFNSYKQFINEESNRSL